MTRSITYLVLIVGAAAVLCGFAMSANQDSTKGNASATSMPSDDLAFALLQIQADLQGSLNDLNLATNEASHSLSATGIEGAGAREVLSKLIKSNPGISQAVTISRDGKILASGSEEYKGIEGTDISNQEYIAKFLGEEDPDPIFSSPFQAVEGFKAVAIIYPVYPAEGELLGGISVTFEPEKVTKAIVSPWMNKMGRSFWIMQTDGSIVYDMDASHIGTDLFIDQLYKPFPSLIALGEKMASERSGQGSYEFQATESNKSVVTKDIYWTTVGLHGKDWRLSITEIRE